MPARDSSVSGEDPGVHGVVEQERGGLQRAGYGQKFNGVRAAGSTIVNR